MKKIIFLILVAAICFWGWQQYAKRQSAGLTGTPGIMLNTNSETDNIANVSQHCMSAGDVEQITGKSYVLQNEVYTAPVKQLDCVYQYGETVGNVFPTVRYKKTLTNDANGIWTRKKTSVKSSASYLDSADYPNSFTVLNPVKEIDQGTFYGKNDQAYFELTYTPVSEGENNLLDHGFKLLEKALNN